MHTKEKKFWELFKDLCSTGEAEGKILAQALSGAIDADEAYEQSHRAKKRAHADRVKLSERIYKAYKEPFELDDARLLADRTYDNVDRANYILSCLSIYEIPEKPDGLLLMVKLVCASLAEMSRIMDYLDDPEGNYMKIEARCYKISSYEERGDEVFREGMRSVYSRGDDPVFIIYWKDILQKLEQILDTSSGNVPLLQNLLSIRD